MKKPTPNTQKLSHWWYALLIIPFIVYLKGLAPSVVLGDTGDFQTAGWIWGVAHPPGYPLYTILVGIIEHLPIPPVWIQVEEFSAVAWRANLLSAFFALCAIATLFALVNRLTGRPIAALIASGALAFSRVFWWHAEIAENDTLSSLFILLIILMAVRWAQERRPKDPYILAIILGLAISHHQSILLFVPAILVYLLLNRALIFNGKQWTAFVLLFILGLTPFLYLPLTRYKTPNGPLNFVTEMEYQELVVNEPEKLFTERYTTKPPMKYFFDYIGRGIYARQRQYTHTPEVLGEGVTTTSDIFGFYINLAIKDFGCIFVLIGLFGIILGSRIKHRTKEKKKNKDDPQSTRSWILLVGAWLVYFLVLHFYPSGDILNAPRYNLDTAGPGLMLPLEIIFAVFIGLGIAGIFILFNSIKIPRRKLELIAFVIGIALVAMNAAGNFPYGDKSGNTLAHEYGLNALDSCPPGAVLVVAGDELYNFWYLHNVHPDPSRGKQGYRRDIKLTTWSGELEDLSELTDISAAMTQAIVRLAQDNPDSEIVTTFFNSLFLEEPSLQSYAIARRGILFVFIPPGQINQLDITASELADQCGIVMIQPHVPEKYRWGYWGGSAMKDDLSLPDSGWWLWPPEADIQWRIGEMLNFYGLNALYEGDKDQAVGYFRQMVLVEPENPDARNHLELALSQSGSFNQ